MVIRVTGVDGTVAWVSAEDVRLILPAQEDKPPLPTETAEGIAIIGHEAPEIKASIVGWNTPGTEGIVIAESPDAFAQRVNAALREGFGGPTYDIPAEPLPFSKNRNGD